jgi:DNA-binding NtrC family response regulator
MILRVVIALDDASLLKAVAREIAGEEVVIERIRATGRAWDRVVRQAGDVIIVSQAIIPAPLDRSVSLLNDLPEIPTTIVITDSASNEEHAHLMACGCDTVLFSGLPNHQLVAAIEATIENRRQLLRRGHLVTNQPQRPGLSDFISESPTMRMFMQVVQRVIPSSTSLLILGETGVGKEQLAKVIHAEGPRSSGPFIAVNCAALPEQLLESELFGHEKGAFTGATRSRRGAFELAHGGTMFLDEIGDMPLSLQAKLLRVLQDFRLRRVGGEHESVIDVRVMAASNRDLEEESRAHTFRRDLFYRLSVVSLTVPPLRERREDIPTLVQRIIARLAPKIGVDIHDIEEAALDCLCRYDWPGNIRELTNVIERALILCEGEMITLADLPIGLVGTHPSALIVPTAAAEIPVEWRNKSLPEVTTLAMDSIERAYLHMVLTETNGHIGQTAIRAGIHPRGLYNKMKKFGLRKEEFRNRATDGAKRG